MSKLKRMWRQRQFAGLHLFTLVCTLLVVSATAHARDPGRFNDPALGVDVQIRRSNDYRVYPYFGEITVVPVAAAGKMWSISQPGSFEVNGTENNPGGPAQIHLGDSRYTLAADEKVCTYQNHVAVQVTQNDSLILYAQEIPLWIYRCESFERIRASLGFGIAHYLAWREQFVQNLEKFQAPYAVCSDEKIDTLINVATDLENRNRQFAIITMASCGKGIVPRLVSMLAQEETAGAALAALRMIGQKASEATPAVAALLTRNFSGIGESQIYHTLEAVGTSSSDATTLLLAKMAKSKLSERAMMFPALVQVGADDPRVQKVLIKGLKHPNYDIRKKAAIAIGKSGRCIPEAIPLLKRNRRRTLLRLSATWALYQMKNAYWDARYNPQEDDSPPANDDTRAGCDIAF